MILLQGVMPTGKNKLPMAQLRKTVSKAGCADTQAWIQSGNLLQGPDLASPSKRLKRYKKRRREIPEMLFYMQKTQDELK